MDTQEHASTTIKAVAGFVTSIVTGAGAFIGLPEYMTPEVIAAVVAAVSAVAGVYYTIRRIAAPAPPTIFPL